MSREAFRDSNRKHSHKKFLTGLTSLGNFPTNELTVFSELKYRKLMHLVESKVHCCVNLNSLPHFSTLKKS